jgi:hypothetical protein
MPIKSMALEETQVKPTGYKPITGRLGGGTKCADWGMEGAWGPRKRKIFYALLINDELDILDIVLHEIFEAVDVIIIVEGALSFTGYYKGMHFRHNEQAFAKYSSKIRRVEVDFVQEMPAMVQAFGYRFGWDEWEYEEWTRHATLRGAHGIGTDDLFLLADVDELVSRGHLQAMARCEMNMVKAPACEVRLIPLMLYQYHFGCNRPWIHAHPDVTTGGAQ